MIKINMADINELESRIFFDFRDLSIIASELRLLELRLPIIHESEMVFYLSERIMIHDGQVYRWDGSWSDLSSKGKRHRTGLVDITSEVDEWIQEQNMPSVPNWTDEDKVLFSIYFS